MPSGHPAQEGVRERLLDNAQFLAHLDEGGDFPKVFFKYFYINTATGEKSAEMLVSAVLSNG